LSELSMTGYDISVFGNDVYMMNATDLLDYLSVMGVDVSMINTTIS